MEVIGDTSNRAVEGNTNRSLRCGDRAVSEVVSIVLLLAVVVVGVGLIAVTIYSQPTPEKTPQVDILVSENDDIISLTHNGGDPLAEGTFYVLADGVRLEEPPVLSGGDWPWSIGGVLQYGVDGAPGQVQVVYSGGGGAVLLKSATFSGTAGAGGPDVPAVPGGGGGLHYDFDTPEERDAWVIDQFREQLEGDSIYFTRAERGSQGVFEGTLQFRVTGGGSYLVIGNNPRTNLAVGDEVKFEFAPGKTPDLMFFMLGNKGWSIQAQGDGVNDLRIFIRHNGVWGPDISGNGDLTESWITDYDDYVSALNFSVQGGTEHTRLIINNAAVLDDENGDTFWFYRIEPAHPTLLVMQYASTGALGNGVYFVGKAERVTRNNNPIYP
jgi:Protein of unknown function (DUF1628).|nr:type IV pilin [Methanoculleus marisnigri]